MIEIPEGGQLEYWGHNPHYEAELLEKGLAGSTDPSWTVAVWGGYLEGTLEKHQATYLEAVATAVVGGESGLAPDIERIEKAVTAAAETPKDIAQAEQRIPLMRLRAAQLDLVHNFRFVQKHPKAVGELAARRALGVGNEEAEQLAA